MAQNRYTTISVEPSFRDRLRARKRGQESYNDLLARLLDQCDRET